MIKISLMLIRHIHRVLAGCRVAKMPKTVDEKYSLEVCRQM